MKKILLLLILSGFIIAQTNEDWELVSSSKNSTIYIDSKNISSVKGGDIYVWVLEKHNPPIVIESVGDRIYKSRTYYLFSQEYQRYSMLQIIYYDAEDNVLKSFDYNRKTDIPTYKYNYPIMRGSSEEVIFQKILKETGALIKDEKKGSE